MKARAVSSRRHFLCKAGAALSAPLAIAAAHAAEGTEDAQALHARLARLEDANAIRELQELYVARLNMQAYEEIASLYADPAHAVVDRGIRSLAAEHGSGPGAIELSPDGKTATGRFHYLAQIETPLEPDCPLVEMARQQGGGVARRRERGALEGVYVKRNGEWRIERLAYTPQCVNV